LSSAIPPPSQPNDRSLEFRRTWTRTREQLIKFTLLLCALLSILTTVGILYVLLSNAVYSPNKNTTAFFQEVSAWDFLTDTQWTPQYEQDRHFGILPLLIGTLKITGIAAIIGLPIGLAGAVYLSEYAAPRTRNTIKPTLEILAGIPTVVYGYFALIFITPYILRPIFSDLLGFEVKIFNAASAGIVVGIMIIPMVSSLSDVPAALSGIIASFLLAISRAIGETMAVTIAAGLYTSTSLSPFEPSQTMTAYIVNVSSGDTPVGSIEYKSLYAVAFTLFLATLAMNILSQWVLKRFREVYQ